MSYYNNIHINNIFASFKSVAEFMMERTEPESEIYRIFQGLSDKSTEHNLKNIQSKISIKTSLQFAEMTEILSRIEPILAFEALTHPENKYLYHSIALWDGFKPLGGKMNAALSKEVPEYLQKQVERYNLLLKAIDILNSDNECQQRFNQSVDQLCDSLRVERRQYNMALETCVGYFHDERPLTELRELFSNYAITRAHIPFDTKYLGADFMSEFNRSANAKKAHSVLDALAERRRKTPLKRGL